jgi:hypothetical protein
MEYDDGLVACADDALIIRRYYFPMATSKRVPYADIRSVQRCAVGKGRIWGSGDFIHWRNLDVRRPQKDTGLMIDTGHRVKPVITPDNPDEVIKVLSSHGVGPIT